MIYQNRKFSVTWKEFGKQKSAVLFESSVWTKLRTLVNLANNQGIEISGVTISPL